ncbi:hypothetical protein HZP84_15575 [Elizabethkingia anophelis]|uniref:Uncharacterized protein n=1 Tax=Elizabethkingia anophelis TaxID=1117645 RepID=A0A7Z7LVH1_9FLAO|nr:MULTISPECIES: hypothetical protein [Elizabethkingia]MCT3631864.1 hypothetical protein [Elizabethkingia anophelis]MCT3635378.1 hypothetical protein [Elizabethkingia anophelis]MCT3674888.1 hypothetical protein [Elizabethkingia anophelis]MCT3682413.1 hypothetical protein [Elizabethkingia anophelis]MCT3692380.1 hypothetical protein [Elizabethkingia anophelis]
MKKKLNLKKIKVANLTKPSLNKEKMNNVNGGGESNFTTVPIVTIGGTRFTYNTLTSCTYNNADTDCVAS